jgi:hypothetical protein
MVMILRVTAAAAPVGLCSKRASPIVGLRLLLGFWRAILPLLPPLRPSRKPWRCLLRLLMHHHQHQQQELGLKYLKAYLKQTTACKLIRLVQKWLMLTRHR